MLRLQISSSLIWRLAGAQEQQHEAAGYAAGRAII